MFNIKPVRAGLFVLWLLVVGGGIAAVSNYQNRHGSAGAAPEHWPSIRQLALSHDRDTLVMFAHPECPCTRASVEELNRLLARCPGRIAVQVLFFKPDPLPADWTETGLQRSTAAIPGVTVQDDPDGVLARKFGAETSGYVVLYDPQGRLLFRGGITAGRGHAGDNAGEDAIASLITGRPAGLRQTPVYGCSLLSQSCSLPGAAR